MRTAPASACGPARPGRRSVRRLHRGLRIATGDNNSPVSFNQTLGGSGGNFSKYSIWLDRAFIKYQPCEDVSLSAGRFDNPFFVADRSRLVLAISASTASPSRARARWRRASRRSLTPAPFRSSTPSFNAEPDLAYDIDRCRRQASEPRQMDVRRAVRRRRSRSTPTSTSRSAVAYYDFTNVQGQLSSPCRRQSTSDTCDTDLTAAVLRPEGQHLHDAARHRRRTIPPIPARRSYQYFGLASAFRDVVLSGRLDLAHFDPIHIILDGEYVNNVAWDRQQVAARALANPASVARPARALSRAASMTAATGLARPRSRSATRSSRICGTGTSASATNIWSPTR